MACPPNQLQCQSIQLIEPDFTLPTVLLPPPGNDPGLTERGDVILEANAGIVGVQFLFPKSGDYRFEYLYVDALGVGNPGVINIVPVATTQFGFTVDLSGVPIQDGYILRWHVVVISITPGSIIVDAPESFRVQIPPGPPGTLPGPPLPPEVISFQIFFVNPRSNTDYGFSELRVENLVDAPNNQSIIGIQVVQKTTLSFKVLYRPVPPTGNYFLTGRTP